jgi:hypothetical protein
VTYGTEVEKHYVGDLRPHQLLTTFGVGAVVDLPNLSAMVMGLEDWRTLSMPEIGEERLRQWVRIVLGYQVERLLALPISQDSGPWSERALGENALVGVPVAAFPRWMVCPACRLLAPLDSDLFELKANPFHPEKTRYQHHNCQRAPRPPAAIPARFLVACQNGHLDDFPWVYFVHQGPTECQSRLRLREFGVSGEAADIQVYCEVCQSARPMSAAFGEEARASMPLCRGRRPHLRDYEEDGCTEQMRTILLGASNSWFPVLLSALSVPTVVDRLGQLVEMHWYVLEKTHNAQEVALLHTIGSLPSFGSYSAEEIWEAVERKRGGQDAAAARPVNIKVPEWTIFTHPEEAPSLPQFRMKTAPVPPRYRGTFSRIALIERLREVLALVGFTRITSLNDFGSAEEVQDELTFAPLSRQPPRWVPASEVHGEGIFIQFDEQAIQHWLHAIPAVERRRQEFRTAHHYWCQQRHLDPQQIRFPDARYILLHTFAHALMRQLSLACGYTAASLRERIYSLPPDHDDGPMAGVLIYTAAPDSEGTLGGLVSLGQPEQLEGHIDAALERMRWCASDPLCAEHSPLTEMVVLHAAACHACLFVPETSCERGNKYLDRSLLVPTIEHPDLAFFDTSRPEERR